MTDSETKKKFLCSQTRQDIANLLDIEDSKLRAFLFSKKIKNSYKSFSIKKRNGKLRTIDAPPYSLKLLQQKLLLILESVHTPLPCAHGYIKGRNILSNATSHVDKKFLLNIDLKDFFSQIHFGRIVGMFIAPPFSLGREAAQTIAQLVCLRGVLPQGAPTSPIISNMVCAYLDKAIMSYAKKMHCTYTRYADDITISTDNKNFPSSIAKVTNEELVISKKFLNILQNNSFEVNSDKVSLRSKYERQEVTGLIVNEKVNVKRQYIKELRAILHHCIVDGIYNTALNYVAKGGSRNNRNNHMINSLSEDEIIDWFKKVLIGKIYFIKQVKGEKSFTYLAVAEKYNTYIEEYFDVTYSQTLKQLVEKKVFILQSENEKVQGSCFCIRGLGLVTSYHVVEPYLQPDNTLMENYNYRVFDGKKWNTIIGNIICYNKDIDYVLFEHPTSIRNAFAIGNSTTLQVGSIISIAGFPEYIEGNTPDIVENTPIRSIEPFLGAPLYNIDSPIFHGASGGIVLNQEKKVVGIIKAGRVRYDDSEVCSKNGFIPIHLVLEDINKQKQES